MDIGLSVQGVVREGCTRFGHKRVEVPAEQAELVVVGVGTVLVTEGLISLRGFEVGSAIATIPKCVHPGVRTAGFMTHRTVDGEYLTGVAIVLSDELAVGSPSFDRRHGRSFQMSRGTGVMKGGGVWRGRLRNKTEFERADGLNGQKILCILCHDRSPHRTG